MRETWNSRELSRGNPDNSKKEFYENSHQRYSHSSSSTAVFWNTLTLLFSRPNFTHFFYLRTLLFALYTLINIHFCRSADCRSSDNNGRGSWRNFFLVPLCVCVLYLFALILKQTIYLFYSVLFCLPASAFLFQVLQFSSELTHAIPYP